jgi:hypothetical protein
MLMARSGHKGISRIDHKKRNTHGWYVRVTFQGTTHSKLFSDSVHGGEEKALQRAIRYRNKLEREVGRPRTDRTVVSKVARSNTGIQGVNRIWKGTGEAYEVTWSPEPNVIQRTSISIRKHGEEEALKKAIALRRKVEKKIYGVALTYPEPPKQPKKRTKL